MTSRTDAARSGLGWRTRSLFLRYVSGAVVAVSARRSSDPSSRRLSVFLWHSTAELSGRLLSLLSSRLSLCPRVSFLLPFSFRLFPFYFVCTSNFVTLRFGPVRRSAAFEVNFASFETVPDFVLEGSCCSLAGLFPVVQFRLFFLFFPVLISLCTFIIAFPSVSFNKRSYNFLFYSFFHHFLPLFLISFLLFQLLFSLFLFL